MTTPEIPASAASDEEPANEHTEPSADAPGTGGSRLAAARDWLQGRTDTSLGRLALLWFRRYFEASRNSGAAATTYITLSVLPTALVIVAVFNLARGDENAFADRLISHMNLGGSTASVVQDLFGTTANNVLAASVTIVIGFLLWGLSIGQQYQDVYARAWRIHAGTAADQLRFTIWFFVFSGLIALMTVSAAGLRAAGWLALLPAWIAGSMVFWLWTPRFLLHRQISLRSLLPGALLATFVVGGDDRHLPPLDRAHAGSEREGVRRVRRRDRAPRLRPDRRHDLDGLCRLLACLGGMATRRERPEELAVSLLPAELVVERAVENRRGDDERREQVHEEDDRRRGAEAAVQRGRLLELGHQEARRPARGAPEIRSRRGARREAAPARERPGAEAEEKPRATARRAVRP